MKHLITVLALSSVLLVNTQLQAHDSYLKGSSGTYVKNSAGECWKTGAYTSGEPACGSTTAMAPAPVKAAPAPVKAAPAPAKAAPVDEPVIKEVINLKGVTFKTGSDVIKTSSYSRLDISVADLKENSDLKVIVAGHTDNVGDSALNRELSKKRAEAVKAYLIDKGIASSRLSARGYGDTEPAASNDTAEGRAKNRRVELRIH